MKIWNKIPIKESGDNLIAIPSYFKFTNPHPYISLGAPYRDKNTIWKLREAVVNKLVKANDYLISNTNFCLLIYDSWRPLEVQNFMFKRAFILECKKMNLDIDTENLITNIDSYPQIIKKVEKFWAYPSFDDNYPPPHSTGGALDVSLTDREGSFVEMGSDIDQMDETSKPNYYENIEGEKPMIWNARRKLLKEVMHKFGFVQHPNEWWHFSYGDQMWAWKNRRPCALYGKI